MKTVVIGYSGHAYVVIDTLFSAGHEIFGYCEQSEKINNPYHLDYLGMESNKAVLDTLKNYNIVLGLGDNKIRAKIYQYFRNNKMKLPFVIHHHASVSVMAKIGDGTVIMPGAIVNSLATIGEGVICNSGSIIEHECQLSNFAHIAPGAVLAGNVCIGESTLVGANAFVKQGISIGKNVIIGAGAVVIKDIVDGMTVYGNPARKKS